MSQFLFPLLTAIAGVLFGLLAGSYGPIIRSRKAHVEWLRQARGELCDRFYALLLQATDNVRAWQHLGSIPDVQSSGDLAAAAAALDLYCSEELGGAVRSAVQKYRAWLVWDPENDDTLGLTLDLLNARSEDFLQEAQRLRSLIQAELSTDISPRLEYATQAA